MPEWMPHRGWNDGHMGNGLADYVFPWFLFIVGVVPRRLGRLGAVFMFLAVIGLVAAGWYLGSRSAPVAPDAAAQVVRLPFIPPENITLNQRVFDLVVVSPDTRMLVFSGSPPREKRQLYLRRLDLIDAQPLPGTEDAIEPFWSPDSRSIAFNAQGKLWRLDLGSARPQALCDASRLLSGTWSRAGVIVFSPNFRSGLMRIPDTGGTPTPATRIDTARGEVSHRLPWFLPDGRHFLFTASTGTASTEGTLVGSLDSPDVKVLLEGFAPAAYAPPGWLLYLRNGVLVAQAFDADSLTLSGEPHPVYQPTGLDSGSIPSRFSVSEHGVLVLQREPTRDCQLTWFDRKGARLSTLGAPFKAINQSGVSLSPDGRRALIQRMDFQTRNQDLWVIDVARGTPSRLTTAPTFEQNPVWSHDGGEVFFAKTFGAESGLYRIPSIGGTETLLLKGAVFSRQASPDGACLLFSQRGVKTQSDIWLLPLSGDAPPQPRAILDAEFDEQYPQVSPDGRWLAYAWDVTGAFEVYVRPITPPHPDGRPGEAQRVSTSGGLQPRWRRDGKELFYVTAPIGSTESELMAVPVKNAGSTLEFGEPIPLFKTHMFANPSAPEYDVSLDGERFLVAATDGTAPPSNAIIMLNWTGAIPRR